MLPDRPVDAVAVEVAGAFGRVGDVVAVFAKHGGEALGFVRAAIGADI